MLQVSRALIVSIVLTLGALAPGPSAVLAGDSRWYVQGEVGGIDLDARFGANWPKIINDDDGAETVEVGYQASRYLAFQAGYHDLGEHDGAGSPCPQEAEVCIAVVVPVRAALTGLSLSAVPRFPINDRWSVFGKLGVIDWESDLAYADAFAGTRRIESFDDRVLLTGFGLRYDLPGGVGLLVERRSFDLAGGWISLGASWRF